MRENVINKIEKVKIEVKISIQAIKIDQLITKMMIMKNTADAVV